MSAAYRQFLERKVRFDHASGVDVEPGDVNPILKPHQAALVRWAVRGGRRAIFARFGLGKTVMQLEIQRLLRVYTGANLALIVCPLGVRQEFKHDADMLGQTFRFVRTNAEVDEPGLYLTNYESVREGKIDPSRFDIASLDEAAVLRSYGSKTYQTFLELFVDVRYRFAATAMPDPNRYKELIHYAGFLGIMDTGQALTRFFQRDSQQANNLTLYPHKEREFWLWVNTWAAFVQRPSDLGFSDEGYELPPLNVHTHEVSVDHTGAGEDRDGQGRLFRNAALGVRDAAREKRDSMGARVEKMVEVLAADPDSHYLLWHHLEAEREAITAAVPTAVEVYGSLDLDVREQRVIDFSEGRIQHLATKPELSGSGCNFQRHCHRAIFLGINYEFHDFIQAVHRIYRFLQTQACDVHLIYAETEREVLRELMAKWARYDEQVERMSEIILQHGLNPLAMQDALTRSIGVERTEASGASWLLANNDCVDECAGMESDSVDLIVTSIPFSNHYEYTPSYNDFGHTEGDRHFFEQMGYLTPQLYRVLRPGRIACVHVKDRILFGSVTGYGTPTVNPFHAKCIQHYLDHGFVFMGMITVVTDVVRENNQTYRLGWTEQCKDGTKMGVGSPEYVLILRKLPTDRSRSYGDVPVVKSKDEYSRARWQVDAHAFWRSSGNRLLGAAELAALGPDKLAKRFTEYSLTQVYDHEEHVRIGEALEQRDALPATFMAIAPGSHDPEVWHDVARMRTLNGEQARRAVELHVCLARDSLVLTQHRGYVPIQEVAVGDFVLTHKGRWRAVTVVANTGVRPVVALRAHGVAHLHLTPDHKVWCRQTDWARERDGAERSEPAWTAASETPAGGYVNLKLPPIDSVVFGDTVFWWTVGRWLADGHIDARGCAQVSIGDAKLEHALSRLGRFAGNTPRHTGTCWQLQLRDPGHALRGVLEQCGHGAANKQLPPIAYGLPVESARALLEGYLSGDGFYLAARDRWMASSVSRALLLGIAMIVQRVHGAIASIHAGRADRQHTIEGRIVQALQEWGLSFDVPTGRRNKPFILGDGAWKKVRSAAPVGDTETWCLRVDEDESFTAEGCIVKNCPLQLDIVERLIRRYSNEGDLVFDPFVGIGTVVQVALKMKRQGRGVELNTGYFKDAVRYAEDAERVVNSPQLFDLLDETALSQDARRGVPQGAEGASLPEGSSDRRSSSRDHDDERDAPPGAARA